MKRVGCDCAEWALASAKPGLCMPAIRDTQLRENWSVPVLSACDDERSDLPLRFCPWCGHQLVASEVGAAQ